MITAGVGGIERNSFRSRCDWSEFFGEQGEFGQNSSMRRWDWTVFHLECGGIGQNSLGSGQDLLEFLQEWEDLLEFLKKVIGRYSPRNRGSWTEFLRSGWN